jgi:hypothetical protein
MHSIIDVDKGIAAMQPGSLQNQTSGTSYTYHGGSGPIIVGCHTIPRSKCINVALHLS